MLAAALALVDREGLDALSMRRLGAELGVEAMSLYNHVPSKAALLDGVHEAILGEMPPPRRGRDFVETLRGMARAFRRVLLAHPQALPIFGSRPAVTEASLRHVETALAVLRGAGLSARESVSAFQVVVTFVVGHALAEVGPVLSGEPAEPRYGALSAEGFPHLTAVLAELDHHDVEEEFEMGLDLILTGLRARTERSKT
ncbi:Transcriptional regulator, TetR family protein [Minicystis rosea]|nr:Transcriptional regulator, TetR family protein [Minicystis rosea]